MKIPCLFLLRIGNERFPESQRIEEACKRDLKKHVQGGDPFAARPAAWRELDPVSHHVYPVMVSKPETWVDLKKIGKEYRMAVIDASEGVEKALAGVGLVKIDSEVS